MTRRLLLLLTLMTGTIFAENRVFELRTYVCNEGKLDALKARFRDHTIRIFARHGMESWAPGLSVACTRVIGLYVEPGPW